MRTLQASFAAASLAIALAAQSPLTTLFAQNNSGSAGGTVIFDLTALVPVVITQIDVNSITGAGVTGTLDVLTCPGTRVGNQNNAAAWTVVSAGNSLTMAGTNVPSVCTLTTPVVLAPGTVGVMLRASSSWQHAYTNGNGSNQNYSTVELTLAAGEAQNAPFTGLFSPRVPNLNLHYTPAAGVATASSYGQGCGNPVSVPLTLAASGRPVQGSTISMNVTNCPATSQLGVNVFAAGAFNPGVPMPLSGMTGCFLYVFLSGSTVQVFIPAGGSGSTSLTVPLNPNLAGLNVYVQSGVIAPGVNPFGALSSNGVDLLLNPF